MRWQLTAAVLGAVIALDAQSPSAPQQPTFRSRVDLVDVDVSVLDKNRLPVSGLTASDFVVRENGKVRPIVVFSAVTLPTRQRPEARWMDVAAPDAATNAVASEGRLVVILMNRAITTEQYPVARRIADAAINQLGPADLGAVIYATHGTPQNFTSDRRLLLDAVHRPFAMLPEGDTGQGGDCVCGTCSLESIERVAQSLQNVRHRRRILIVIGSNLSIQSNGQCGGPLGGLRERTERALEAANLTVYTIDPSGLTSLTQSAADRSVVDPARAALANLNRRANLMYFPDLTGGRTVMGSNEPVNRIPEIFRESGAYYTLGFQPGSPREDRRFQEIQIKVNRPGVSIQARRGYFSGAVSDEVDRAWKHETTIPRSLRAAISGMWPQTDLELHMTAVPWSLPGMQSAAVSVTVGVRGVIDPERLAQAARAGEERSRDVDVLVGAFDREGRAMASVRETLQSVPHSRDGAVSFEVVARLPLRPGRYEIRAAVDDGPLAQTGSVYGYVEVPDYPKTRIALSNIVLETTPRTTPAYGADIKDLVPMVPTTVREFRATDKLTAFVREHQGLDRALMPGYLTATIQDVDDQPVFHYEQRLLPELFGADRAMEFSMDVPVARLRPGEYLLTIEARHGNDSVARDVWFRIR